MYRHMCCVCIYRKQSHVFVHRVNKWRGEPFFRWNKWRGDLLLPGYIYLYRMNIHTISHHTISSHDMSCTEHMTYHHVIISHVQGVVGSFSVAISIYNEYTNKISYMCVYPMSKGGNGLFLQAYIHICIIYVSNRFNVQYICVRSL